MVEVSIATFHRPPVYLPEGSQAASVAGPAPNSFVAAARAEGVKVDVIHERFRFDPRVTKQLRNIVSQHAPDIIQTHMVKSHFLVKLSGIHDRYPWIAYHHGYTTTDLKMRAYNQLNRWSLPSARRVIAVCRPFADQLSRVGVQPERLVVCHNSIVRPSPITEDQRSVLRQKLNLVNGERVVLSVGRLSREKGHTDLVAALAVLRELDPELRLKLIIIGEGPTRAQVERVAQQAGLTDRVTFLGQISDVQPYYAIADALALPSHSEGSPNVLLEAMAAGIPVVASAVGGVPEIAVDESSALLVPARDTQKFARALYRVLTDTELAQRLGEAAIARVEDEFSPESYARMLVGTYDKLLAEQSERRN